MMSLMVFIVMGMIEVMFCVAFFGIHEEPPLIFSMRELWLIVDKMSTQPYNRLYGCDSRGGKVEDLIQFFKALSDPTRLQITALLLWERELCVCDIENILDLSQSKASRHLRYLLHSGLLTFTRKDKWVYYALNKDMNENRKKLIKLYNKILKEDEWKDLRTKYNDWSASGSNQCNL